MEKTKYQENCSLLISSSDKYECAWYPYFELLKIFWNDRPKKIYLNTEKKHYSCSELNLVTVNAPNNISWSERLYRCLEKIDTKYIIFTLEDFFLVDYVDNAKIQQAYEYMESNPNIAVCRLFASDHKDLIKSDEYGDFYIADENMYLRVDAQVALWNRETLMSLLDFKENPWEFEKNATQRAKTSKKIFLYYYQEKCYEVENMIVPYYYLPQYGYGIAWGSYWLWKNKELFEKNNIKNVDFKSFGVLSERTVKFRFKYLYNQSPKGIAVIIKPIYKLFERIKRSIKIIRLFGLKLGTQKVLRLFKNRTK